MLPMVVAFVLSGWADIVASVASDAFCRRSLEDVPLSDCCVYYSNLAGAILWNNAMDDVGRKVREVECNDRSSQCLLTNCTRKRGP